MDSPCSNATRLRAARERAGLSVSQMAERAGVSEACVWDLESHDDELTTAYAPANLERFAVAVGVRPIDLLGIAEHPSPITSIKLASAIRETCKARGMTPKAFSEAAGWDVTQALDAPQLFLSDTTIDGIQWVCRELGIEWERFICGLHSD